MLSRRCSIGLHGFDPITSPCRIGSVGGSPAGGRGDWQEIAEINICIHTNISQEQQPCPIMLPSPRIHALPSY